MIRELESKLQDSLKSPKDLNPTINAGYAVEKVTGTFVYIIRKNDCPDLRRDRYT